jgi:alkylation response protein AidB-like acyl-CoA dehydrogenase
MTGIGSFTARVQVVPISERLGLGRKAWRSVARDISDFAFRNAGRYDVDGAFPLDDVAALQASGLLSAVLPHELGGAPLGGLPLVDVLRQIGSGSLPLGRLFEGHVNALGLVLRYGRREQVSLIAGEAREGKLSGVWNTDDRDAVRLVAEGRRYRLEGRKILASGAGHIERPLITASDQDGRRLIVMPHLRLNERADLSQWTVHGMRASATGSVDFSGVAVEPIEIVGRDGDYERQPTFSGGAWRFAAVQLGGMERLFDLLRAHMRSTGRGANPHQAARLGEAAIAVETARLWVERAALIAEEAAKGTEADRIVAYVNFARLAIERAGLTLMESVNRSVGLQAFVRPNPIERVSRDLATYLRQPGPDQALTSAAAWVLAQESAVGDMWEAN